MPAKYIQPDSVFDKFGFTRRAHKADKIGPAANKWEGSITLSSETPGIDEIEAARNFEALVMTGALPMHGNFWRLSSINFNFSPSDSEKLTLGAEVTCIVTLGYVSDVVFLTAEETAQRMESMGVPLTPVGGQS